MLDVPSEVKALARVIRVTVIPSRGVVRLWAVINPVVMQRDEEIGATFVVYFASLCETYLGIINTRHNDGNPDLL